jgi:predicted dinucleotide-binding enzyme
VKRSRRQVVVVLAAAVVAISAGALPAAAQRTGGQGGPERQGGLPQDAATFGDIVVIAVPYGVTPQIGKDYAALTKGKIVMDLGNPREDRDGPMATEAKARGTGVATA